jgi:hypothetical protein
MRIVQHEKHEQGHSFQECIEAQIEQARSTRRQPVSSDPECARASRDITLCCKTYRIWRQGGAKRFSGSDLARAIHGCSHRLMRLRQTEIWPFQVLRIDHSRPYCIVSARRNASRYVHAAGPSAAIDLQHHEHDLLADVTHRYDIGKCFQHVRIARNASCKAGEHS